MLKKIIPKSLFARFILIIIIPTILTQLFATYIFFNRHWENVSSHIVKTISSEIVTIINIRNGNFPINVVHDIESKMPLKIEFFANDHQQFNSNKKYKNYIQDLYIELKHNINFPFEIEEQDQNIVKVIVQVPTGILNISFAKKRIDSPTTHIFILWMTGTSAFFFLISVIFSRNQIRPIIRLARAAESFGKGNIIHIKPTGALEVRKATHAFIKMQHRIERHIKQRTQMLAGISHDLRTPITRLKLRLAMSKSNEKEMEEINYDILEMEKMVNSYLDFVRGRGDEKHLETNIATFLENIIHQSHKGEIIFHDFSKDYKLLLPQNAMTRVIQNILDNAFKFAKKIHITLRLVEQGINIIIEDDGCGIEKKEYQNIFKPFYRIDQSRNLNNGGVGLGLAIVKDIITTLGGEVNVTKSELLGGAKFTLFLPK